MNERALRTVYQDYTSTFEELLKHGVLWYRIHCFFGPKIWDKRPIYLKSINLLDKFKQNV